MNILHAQALHSWLTESSPSVAVSEHIKTCPECAAELRRLEELRLLLSSLGNRPSPPDLALKIRVSLASQDRTFSYHHAIKRLFRPLKRASFGPLPDDIESLVGQERKVVKRHQSAQIPLPFATAGIGLFLSYLFPSKINPLTATAIGFGIGILLLYIAGKFETRNDALLEGALNIDGHKR